MAGITTHVLDLAEGRPADGVEVRLERREGDGWHPVARGGTDADGRVREWSPPPGALRAGEYRLVFAAGAYQERRGRQGFYGEIVVAFVVRKPEEHHHVPLLLSPHGYATYRGS